LDFDTKIYTEIPIPFDDNQKSSTIQRIAVSETGKYFVVTMDVANDITAYLFYDKDFKFLFKETKKTLSESWKIPNRFIDNWEPYFIHEDYVISPARIYLKSDSIVKYCDFYNISSKSITKRIKFEHSVSIDYKNNDIIILDALGRIGLLDLDALPVENDLPSKTIQSIQYKDSSLLLNSTSNDKVEISLRDYNGGLLFSQKEAYLRSGINTIKLNIPLPNGVYFCVIKTTSETNSYKFIVSQ
jgi:hypothetical protein